MFLEKRMSTLLHSSLFCCFFIFLFTYVISYCFKDAFGFWIGIIPCVLGVLFTLPFLCPVFKKTRNTLVCHGYRGIGLPRLDTVAFVTLLASWIFLICFRYSADWPTSCTDFHIYISYYDKYKGFWH